MLNNTIIPQDARAWAERVIRSPIKWTGDNGLTNCPLSSHGGPDRHPSFSVDVSKQVYFCHTEQVGGSFRELGKLIGEEWLGDRPSTSKPKKEIEAVYDYTDATGKLIYQVVRYNPKDFKQRRPDGKGGHTWNIQGVTLLPYKLLELLRVKPGQTIFIVEGEKDVQSLNKMGLVATCNHGGAGKWREEHSRHFPKGASVVILPDNDDPGQMHSVMVARSLIKRGCKVKVVELPGLPPKSDVSDWLKSGRTKDELLKLVMDADDWRDKELDVDVGGDKAQLKDNPYAHLREHLKQEDYAVNSHGELCYMKYDQNGKGTLTAIANFVAWPIRQIAKDNGIDRTTKFEIVGLASGGIPLPAAMVPSEKFAQMQWAIDAWGLRANIKPGAASKDKIRYITQALGINAPKDLLFGHLGWKKIDGKWAYLHAGGAINNADAIVDLNDEGLTSYELPPAVKDAKEAMQCSLQTLNLAPRSVTMSLFSLIFLAPLCEPLRKANLEPAFLLWLNGTTGSMKSTLAALFTSHFGIFSGKSLPASFKDTANSLERKAFFTKDSVLVVDDYHPNSSQSEALKMREAAERLLRGYGDRIGRGRLNADSSAKKHLYLKDCVLSPVRTSRKEGKAQPLDI
ncbi:MAG: hypothetical protein NHB14_01525 [Desulfosporosinus sp.]|nr:hypothetical protein [Desulfosporosinus sp.]